MRGRRSGNGRNRSRRVTGRGCSRSFDFSNRLGSGTEPLKERLATVDASEVAKDDSKVHLRKGRSVYELHGRIGPLILASPERSEESCARCDESLGRKQRIPSRVGIVEVGGCRYIGKELLSAHSVNRFDWRWLESGVIVGLQDVSVCIDLWQCHAIRRNRYQLRAWGSLEFAFPPHLKHLEWASWTEQC
jgi:hypothetical protein